MFVVVDVVFGFLVAMAAGYLVMTRFDHVQAGRSWPVVWAMALALLISVVTALITVRISVWDFRVGLLIVIGAGIAVVVRSRGRTDLAQDWWGHIVACVGFALVVWLVAAIIIGTISFHRAQRDYAGRRDPWASFQSAGEGFVYGAIVAILAVIVFAVVFRTGIVFALGTVIAGSVLLVALFNPWPTHRHVVVLAAVLAFLGGIALGRVLPSPWGGASNQHATPEAGVRLVTFC